MTLDLKNYFSASPMNNLEYMKISQRHIPPDIIQKYDFAQKFHDVYVYCKIKKGVYRLKQAALHA